MPIMSQPDLEQAGGTIPLGGSGRVVAALGVLSPTPSRRWPIVPKRSTRPLAVKRRGGRHWDRRPFPYESDLRTGLPASQPPSSLDLAAANSSSVSEPC